MKHALLLSVLGIGLLSSCSTAFKTGQTPDDVYFSPGREVGNDEVAQQRQQDEYQNYISSLDDEYLRMKVANRSRWASIDNFNYWNDSRYDFSPYSYYNGLNSYSAWNPGWNLGFSYGNYYSGYGYGYNTGFYPGYGYYGWNSPVCTVIYYKNPHYYGGATAGYTAGSNISAYSNKVYNNYNSLGSRGSFVPGSSSSFGSLVKRVFSSDNTSSYDRAARTYTPTNNSSSTPSTSSSAGGNSGGFKSTGSSTSTGRGGRG